MKAQKRTRPRVEPRALEAANQGTYRQGKDNPSSDTFQSVGDLARLVVLDLAEAGKTLAMLRYNCGDRSLEQTERAFSAHPDWRTA
jgi:hypothetical protein